LEEEAKFSVATQELLDLESPPRPAKVVHLPPRDIQEQRLRERREALEEETKRAEADKASSPSSTVGAYSAATPLPPQDSPDTSPDTEAAELDVPPPKDLQPTPEERRAQEEHDRLLAAQKEIAKRQAMGDEATPDDQLRLEAREAVARDAEETATRESVGGPEANAMNAMRQTEAEQVMEEVRADEVPQQAPTPAPSQDERPTARPTILPDAQAGNPEDDDDGDNITVTPRLKAPSNTAAVQPPPRMTTRVSSGAMNRKSVSEILGESSSQPIEETPRRQQSVPELSPRATSSSIARPPHAPVTTHAATSQPSSRRHVRSTSHPKAEFKGPALRDLAPLKGAAGDPDRDYLEPLFRIQAHDSQSSRTRPLTELTRTATKHLSTEDHFTTIHERMDYRLLRRIYQLQNANKWSLRQMEKAKEPEQPLSHRDHLMVEMRWMRKDFKAERKMKKSVCAWLAARCAEWVAADAEGRRAMQVKVVRRSSQTGDSSQPPGLDAEADSAPEDDTAPPTPRDDWRFSSSLVVAPELKDLVCSLQKSGRLDKALESLPVVGTPDISSKAPPEPLTAVSKFTEGKLLPKAFGPIRKRSRYDYEDDAELLENQPQNKRRCEERDLEPEDHECALFYPDSKPMRDRLHANTAFRPPSEFPMPAILFYEYRNGSQWIWEDDQKLRKLAKEYSFNWSLIADEMALPSRYKSAAQRRTPWECFERWVELESLPADMRKTMYFKTWFQRLEQSQNAADRRHQATVAAMQAQAQQNGQPFQLPQRRRTTPTRVEKRRDNRYLWLLDGMRKNARKKENNAFKQAEGEHIDNLQLGHVKLTKAAQRAAAQRKSQTESTAQTRGPKMTPQEFSKRRQEQDLRMAEAQRQHRLKLIEAQKAQMAARLAAQQQGMNGVAGQQRPGTANPAQQQHQMQANGQQQVNMNGQLPQQPRPSLPLTTRNGHLAVPQVNAQGIPQAQMRAAAPMQHPNMQRMAQANAQQMNAQYANQQYQMANGVNVPSPGGQMTQQQQQQLHQNQQQLLTQMQAQQQQQHQVNGSPHAQGTGATHAASHQMSASPSMPPPPTPRNQPQQLGQLSSGHMPRLMGIKNELREQHPNLSEEQLNTMATSKLQAQSAQLTNTQAQARHQAMNAAAGIQTQSGHGGNMSQAYNQAAFQNNRQMVNGNTPYMNGDGTTMQTPTMNGPTNGPQAAAAYANQVRAHTHLMQQSPNAGHAQLNGTYGSPGMAHVSPNMTPASPSAQYSNMGQMGGAAGLGGRPPSRSNTPQMQRLGSSGGTMSGTGMANGMQSPNGTLPQGSPRNMQANMAR
jgi:chromatin modification-related protein VID21